MNQKSLTEIEQRILDLPIEEQQILIARVTERMHHRTTDVRDFEAKLAEMANDENIQRELHVGT